MSTVTPPVVHRQIPEGWTEFRCAVCNRPTLFRQETHDVACMSCRRAQAESAANDLRGTVRDMIAGSGIFDILPVEDRREQLHALGLYAEPARNAADAPDEATRQQIEFEDEQYHRELTMQREMEAEQDAERFDAFA